MNLHGFCLMLEAWGDRRQPCSLHIQDYFSVVQAEPGGGVGGCGKFLTTQSSVIWAQQTGASRTKHVWNQVSAKSLHISSLSRLLTRHKWKRTIRQQKEGRVSIVYIDLIKYLSKACDHWQYALWPNNRLHINNGFFFFPRPSAYGYLVGEGGKKESLRKKTQTIYTGTHSKFLWHCPCKVYL